MAPPRKFRRPSAAQAKRYAKRRAGRVQRSDSDLTPAEWTAIATAWGACAYCGTPDGPFQKDCVQPIARGGSYTAANVVPACRSCNASKSAREVTSWLRSKRYDEAAFLSRFVEVSRLLAPDDDGDAHPDDE
ncbi:MAG: HNH endonuclease [Promicromonosporaceae bacterium]|nr:HNH endonuclease [Promicromonosporaceae bacterium]